VDPWIPRCHRHRAVHQKTPRMISLPTNQHRLNLWLPQGTGHLKW
jgi:hypothetical protein